MAAPRKPAPFSVVSGSDAILNFIFSPEAAFIGANPALPSAPAASTGSAATAASGE